MKKSFKYLLIITLVFILNSCSKIESIKKMSDNDKIQIVIESILQDNNFITFLNTIADESLMIKENKYTITEFEMSNNKIARTIVNFVLHNPYYNKLTIYEKKKVLENILSKEKNKLLLLNDIEISSKVSRLNNNFIINKIASNGLTNKPFKVTREEIIDCLINIGFSMLLTYGKEINDIGILLRGGTPINLLYEMGIDLIKKASPWWTVTALVSQFGYCLYDKSQN